MALSTDSTLDPLFESDQLDEGLKRKLRELFWVSPGKPLPAITLPASPIFQVDDKLSIREVQQAPGGEERPLPSLDRQLRHASDSGSDTDSGFVSDEDLVPQIPEPGRRPASREQAPFPSHPPPPSSSSMSPLPSLRPVLLSSPSLEFTDNFSSLIIALQEALEKVSRNPTRDNFQNASEFLSQLVSRCLTQKEGRSEWIQNLVTFLIANFDDELGQASEKPAEAFVLFPTLLDGDFIKSAPRNSLLDFYLAFSKSEPVFGFRFLEQLSRVTERTQALELYNEAAKLQTESGNLAAIILRDLELCKEEYEVKAFFSISLLVLQEYADLFVGNTTFLRLLVSFFDFQQLQQLLSRVTLGDFDVIGKRRLTQTCLASLSWDSFEQTAVWQLVAAENLGDSPHLEAFCCEIFPKIMPCTCFLSLFHSFFFIIFSSFFFFFFLIFF